MVHPRRPDSTYPFGDLCGAGVAFKVAWRLATMWCGSSQVRDDLRALLLEMLALAALGVIADVVPLVGENRVIARFGLSKIKSSRFSGLRALVKASGLDGENVNAEDVGFKLAPRLNACGRMGHAREAVELLTVAAGARAEAIAKELTRLNDERRATERAIFEQAAAMAEEAGMTRDDSRAVVLSHPDWHAGVVGIVCSRLVERYHRPTILLCEKDGVCHGSARSVDGFDLHGALSRCAEHLTQYGGHEMAAGMKLPTTQLPAFARSFIDTCNATIGPEALTGRSSYDCEAVLSELTLPQVRQLERLGPFGRCNPRVRLLLRGLRVAGRPGTFGGNNKHLSMFVGAADAGGALTRVFGWNWAHALSRVRVGGEVDALVCPVVSNFGGSKVELELTDLACR